MSIFEYDKEEEERKLRKAEFEAGEQSKTKEFANSLAQDGMKIEKIAQLLNLNEEQVQELLKAK